MFHLHSLGWHSFQQLCLSLTRENLGQTVEAFLDTNDGGQDGAFEGTWNPRGNESLTGRFVIQCKFTSRAGYSLRPSDIAEELNKVERLVRDDRCDVYVLMTNAGISGTTELRIREMLAGVGVRSFLALGTTWIEQQILESKRLRMLVPRVYGLGDLSQILDERAYAQAMAVLESMRDDLAKVVVTDSYRKAAHALATHGFVLLIGEPAAGKTTIASMLAMASADQWDASVIKIDRPQSVVDHWNPHENSQLFWIDDAFGVTQYESALVTGWNHILPQMKTLLRQGCRVVMTSRDYIYNRARHNLKVGAFPLFRESQVVIDVHDLSSDERRQILYNHLKLGTQPRDFRTKLKPYLDSVANQRRFIPEIARRLADPFFTNDLSLSQRSLERFVDQREQFLIDVCEGLDTDSKAALALVYMHKGHLPSPIQLAATEEEALLRLNSSLGACSTALQALHGSLVSHSVIDGESFWTYRHPTIADAYASILRRSPELLSIYVFGSDIDKLMEQVTCGDMNIEGAVILPRSLYGIMIERLRQHKTSSLYKTEWMATWGAQQRLLRFLAQRCGKDFLEAFLAEVPQVFKTISKPGLYLDYSPETDLVVKLFELKMLPEDVRQIFAQTVIQYALDGDDARVLQDSRMRAVLTTDELSELRRRMRRELVPRLDDVRLDVQSNHDSDDDPEDHMSRFMEMLDTVENEFANENAVKHAVSRERSCAKAWIAEHQPDSFDDESSRQLAVSETEAASLGCRSIFDDVDE